MKIKVSLSTQYTALQRARLAGYDIGKIWYHGSNHNFDSFDNEAKSVNRSQNPSGIYLTPHKDEAEEYGNIIYSLYTRANNPYVIGKSIVSNKMAQEYGKLLKQYTSYNDDWIDSEIVPNFIKTGVFKDVSGYIKTRTMQAGGYDSYKDGRHLCVFEPHMLRRVGAEFDESKKHSSNLMA